MPKKDIFGPKFRHFYYFTKFLQMDRFEGADLKLDYSFFRSLAQKYPVKSLLFSNLSTFVFPRNIAITQIRGCSFEI